MLFFQVFYYFCCYALIKVLKSAYKLSFKISFMNSVLVLHILPIDSQFESPIILTAMPQDLYSKYGQNHKITTGEHHK